MRGLATALLLSALTGCNPGPKYARPPAQAPTAYKEATPKEYKEGEGWKIAQPGDDHLRGKWWELYNDPQLSALEEQVAISNQNIKASEANFRAAVALVSNARAGLFPTVTTAPSYTRSKFSRTTRGATVVGGGAIGSTGSGVGNGINNGGSGTGTSTGTNTGTGTGTGAGTGTGTGANGGGSSNTGVGGTANTGILNTYSATASVSYTVDLWHRIRNTIAADAFSAQASAADIATATLTLQAELAQDYFEIRSLDAEHAILHDTVVNYRDTLQLTKVRYQGGIASDEDVSQAQTQLDTSIAQETDVTVARATFEHAIATLIGKPAATFALPIAQFVPNPPAVPLSLPSELLERRPDIASAERRVASANAEIGVARAAYYPNLTLSATSGFQTSQFSQWFIWPSNLWSIGPAFAETIFDGGARGAVVAQARATYDNTVATYRQTVLTAFQAVEDYLATLRILSQEIVEQHTAVASANHYLDLSLVRYRGGVDSYLNVITAQNALLTNRLSELQVELRQMEASVSLVMALGGGWEDSQLPSMRQLSVKRQKPNAATMPVIATDAPAAPNPPAYPQQ